jgi:uroporphyrin-III C-methyltransferase
MEDQNLNSSAAAAAPRRLKSWALALAAIMLVAIALFILVKPNGTALIDTPARIDSAGADRLSNLETKLNDALQVNRVLREQSLALQQRLALVEQSLVSVQRGVTPSTDALKRDEASYLLTLAQTRLSVFYDPKSALSALQQADQLLSSMTDPRLTQVRQTLAIEIAAVQAAPVFDIGNLQSALQQLVKDLPNVPVVLDPESNERSRLRRLLDRYLVVRREGDAMPVIGGSSWAVRESITIELERAQLALEKHDSSTWQRALNTALSVAEKSLAQESAQGVSFMSALQSLRANELLPNPPTIGGALRELQRLSESASLIPDPVSADPNSAGAATADPILDAPATESPAELLPPADALPTLPMPQETAPAPSLTPLTSGAL